VSQAAICRIIRAMRYSFGELAASTSSIAEGVAQTLI